MLEPGRTHWCSSLQVPSMQLGYLGPGLCTFSGRIWLAGLVHFLLEMFLKLDNLERTTLHF